MAAPVYRFLTLNPSYAAAGDKIVADLPLESVKYGRTLSGAGAFSARLNVRHPTATLDNLRAGYHQIAVERNGIIVWCGPIWTVQTSLAGNDPYLQIGANEWFSWFLPIGDTGRVMEIDAPVEWDSLDQIEVAEACISAAQAHDDGTAPNSDIGVQVEGGVLSGITRDMGQYTADSLTSFGTIITDMAQKIDGFDFTIECAWDDTALPAAKMKKVFKTYYPHKLGRSIGGIDTQSLLTNAAATWDATRMGDHVIGKGDSSLDPSVVDVINDYWRRDLVRTWTDIMDQPVLDAQTSAAATRYGRPVVLPQVSLINAQPIDWLQSFELGWLMGVNIDEGYLSINQDLRIVGYEMEVNQGAEVITLMFNDPLELP